MANTVRLIYEVTSPTATEYDAVCAHMDGLAEILLADVRDAINRKVIVTVAAADWSPS